MYGGFRQKFYAAGLALVGGLLSVVPSRLSAQGEPPPPGLVFDLPNPKDCGLVTRMRPNSIAPGCLQSVENIYYDQDWSMYRRNGYAKYNLTPCTGSAAIKGLWNFMGRNGVSYLVAFSGGNMFYSPGNGSCSPIVSTGWGLTATAEMQCVQAFGQLNCTDGVDAPFWTDVASSGTLTNAPYGTLIGVFRNRIIMGGISGSGTQISLSGELNPQDWQLNLYPNLSTSPAIIDISGTNDGQAVKCLLGEFQNQFLIGRDHDLYALSGYSNQDFTLRKVSNQIGCIEPKSVQEVNNQLIWMSRRGIEGFTGTQIVPISYPIDPTITPILRAYGNSVSQTLTLPSDWNQGNLCASGNGACMSSTISPGDVVPSSWTITESSTTFAAGSGATVSTTVAQVTAGQAFVGSGFEEYPSISPWTVSGSWFVWPYTYNRYNDSLAACQLYGWQGENYASVNASNSGSMSETVSILEGGTLVPRYSNTYTADACTVSDIDISTQTAATFVVVVKDNRSGYTMTSPAFSKTKDIIYMTGNVAKYAGFLPNSQPFFDMPEPMYVLSSTFTSAAYDTGMSTPTYGPFVVGFSSDSISGLSFSAAASSSSNSGFDSPPIAQIPGALFSASARRYIEYNANFITTSSSMSFAVLSTVTLSASTTGYYITPCIAVSSPTSWGAFAVDAVTNGGSFSFAISTGATCNAATSPSATWNAQSPNAQISVSTGVAYIAARALFSLASATQAPTLNDMVFTWNNGSSRPPTSSVQYSNRYYLFYTTSTAAGSHNDHALVYDYNSKWTLLSDVSAYSATLYNNVPFLGDSNATGSIFQFDTGQDDAGNPYSMSFKTADMDLGNPAQRKVFQTLYLTADGPASASQNISVSCNYSLDGSSTTYPLSSTNLSEAPEASGYYVAKMPFPISQPTSGHWINLSCSYTGAQGPVRIYSLKLIYGKLSYD